MEETISMNTKKTYIVTGFCALLLSVLCFSACSETEEVTLPAGKEPASISFSVNDIQTRLGYDFEHTNFEDGEYIGCVIAEVNDDGSYTYLRNSAWTYRAADNMLLFQYYWWYKTDGSNVSYGKVSSADKEAMGQYNPTENLDKIIVRENSLGGEHASKDDAYVYSPYLANNSDKNLSKKLKFFFYYPYVDDEKLQNDYLNNKGGDYKKLIFPNCATSETQLPANENSSSEWNSGWNAITLTGEPANETSQSWSSSNALFKYGWQEYPCFVNHTQGDIMEKGEKNDPRLLNSDFLWAGLDGNESVDATTDRTFSLHFKKKTATILVYSETKLDDIYFIPSGANKLRRGNQINLSTGELTNYPEPDNPYYSSSIQQANRYFKADEHIIPCYRGPHVADGEDYYFYRLVLPAQENCDFKMHIKIPDTDIDKDIDLSADNKLTELKEGYLYSIRISKVGDTVIYINDWKDGDGGELEEVEQQP